MHGVSTISSYKQLFCSFSSDFFPHQLTFDLFRLESSGSFHLVSAFPIIYYYFSRCCEYWLPCAKLRLHYKKIDKVYRARYMNKDLPRCRSLQMQGSLKNGESVNVETVESSRCTLPSKIQEIVLFSIIFRELKS